MYVPEEVGQQFAKHHRSKSRSVSFALSRWPGWISHRDTFDFQDDHCYLFEGNSFIYLHCCDFSYCFLFTVSTLLFLRLNGVLAHFSFFLAPGKRHMCILPLSEPLLKKLEEIYSPAVVKVTSSIIFEVCSLTVRS